MILLLFRNSLTPHLLFLLLIFSKAHALYSSMNIFIIIVLGLLSFGHTTKQTMTHYASLLYPFFLDISQLLLLRVFSSQFYASLLSSFFQTNHINEVQLIFSLSSVLCYYFCVFFFFFELIIVHKY